MKTNTKELKLGLKLSLVAVLSSSTVALAANGVPGPGAAAAPMVLMTIAPTLTFPAAGHVVNGVALRNMMSGTIGTRGVPAGAPIKAAYLYWNYGNNVPVGALAENMIFNGHLVTGTKVADGAGLCWGTTGTHTYRAVVTPFIPLANPNQDYIIGGGGDNTSGLNPWTSPVTIRKNNGAALVVFYGGTALAPVLGDAMLYDRLTGSAMLGGAHTFTLTHAALPVGAAQFSMVGADGQRGGTHTNTSSNEIGKFNAVQFSGPPVAASDWDGSGGLPLPQLWDVHTHNVSLNGTASSIVDYTAPGDCVMPVAFVIDKQ